VRVQTMARCARWNEVLMMRATPVSLPKLLDDTVVERARLPRHAWMRAESSTWVTADHALVRPHLRDQQHVGLSQSISNHSAFLSARTEGAKGRKPSRNLIFM